MIRGGTKKGDVVSCKILVVDDQFGVRTLLVSIFQVLVSTVAIKDGKYYSLVAIRKIYKNAPELRSPGAFL